MTSSRFEIRRTLGEGGMGVVYEARDRERDMVVALKTLRTMDANLLYHFKNEFRSLADLAHPNLCSLYELFQADGHWFFTMEMVAGTDFMSWIEKRDARPPEPTTDERPRGTLVDFGAGRAAGGTMLEFVPAAGSAPALGAQLGDSLASEASVHPFDEPRLRDALAQLAAGLNALHAAGKVHRDIKPGNILVTPEGRVVIMDFGLVADEAILAELEATGTIAGTPTFMAPEQGSPGAAVGPSADWYAVGVMMYQILTQRLPFRGETVWELIEAKKTLPPAPNALAFGVPLDLANLCHRLLSPDPASRPSGDEVLRLLGGRASVPVIGTTGGDLFVGRRAELGVLHTALADSRRGAVTVFVRGPSGLGKSALVRRFLDEIHDSGTLVLKGRCYAEETVPYKACDGMFDALSRHLVTMDPYRVMDMFPQSTMLAARLFPTLRRVSVFANAVTHDPNVSAMEMRSRAFSAVVELLSRVAAMQPLVLFVDDLQWADPDSVLLLRELLQPGAARQLVFVASIRSGEATSDLAATLARQAGIEPRWIDIAPLPPDDAMFLVDRILGREVSDARRQAIAREAGGHPLFLAELAHHLSLHADSELASTTQLDEALWQRTMALDPETRHLLQIIAVAGSPIDMRVAADASELSPTRTAPLVNALRAARFVKTSTTATGANVVEPYHDRVREAVVTRLEPSQFASVSSHVAHAMIHAGLADTAPEQVVRHLFAAGDTARGRDLAEKAAAKALVSLAFDRAAEFLKSALNAGPRDAVHARALYLQLAEALASAGRGGEAADSYLAAAEVGLDEADRLDCRRHAADQLLVSGHVDRGLAELRGVLAQLGERVPETPDEALASMDAVRGELDRAPIELAATPTPGTWRLHDVCQSTSLGLVLVDNVRGADFQARAVRFAIQTGDPRRLIRGLVFEAIYRAQESDDGRRRAAELLRTANQLAQQAIPDDPWAKAYGSLGEAFLAYYHGRFRRAVEIFKDCDHRFRTLPGVAWEQNTIRIHRLRATDYQGAWGELRALYDEYMRDAHRRDDRYVGASLTRWFNVLWLAHDRPDLAGADLDRSQWTAPAEGKYHLQHFLELRARVELALYRGDGAAQGAWARPGLAAADGAYLLRIQIARAIADWLLGRLAACEGNLDEIELRAARLDAQQINYAGIWSGLLASAAIAQRGERAQAVERLAFTAELADTNDFPLCATIARLRAGQLRRDPAMVDAALAWMTGQDIKNPLRMAEVFAPGFGG